MCSARSSRSRWSSAVVWLGVARDRAARASVPLARPPQADPVVRLPRLRAGAARLAFALVGGVRAVHQRRRLHVPRGLQRSRRRRAADRRDVGGRDRAQPGRRRRPRSSASTRTCRRSIRRCRWPSCPPPTTAAPAMDRPKRPSRSVRRRSVAALAAPADGARWLVAIAQAASAASSLCLARRAGRLGTSSCDRRADRRIGQRLVIADLPVDADIVARLADRTTRGWATSRCRATAAGRGPAASRPRRGNVLSLFRQTVAFMDCTNWATARSAAYGQPDCAGRAVSYSA